MAEEMNNTTATDTANEAAGAEEQQQPKTYTFDEVQALLQSETDKRVTAALKKAEKKHQKELSLASLDDDARAKAEKDARIAELEAELAQRNIEANRSEIKSVLSSRGLSAEFADLLNIGDDIEEAQASIEAFDKLYKAAVKAEVERRLAGNAPKGNGGAPAEFTEKDIKKMSLAELQQLKATRPEVYNRYFN